MKCISEDTIESTWQTIAELPPEKTGEAIFAFSEAQPNLIDFVMDCTDDMNKETSEFCTYILYVVYQMFANASKSNIPLVTAEQMEAQYNATCDVIDKIQEADGDPEAVGLESTFENQPNVYQYLSEMLLDDSEDDPEDQMSISEEDTGEIYMMMKCVIDVVDSVTNG